MGVYSRPNKEAAFNIKHLKKQCPVCCASVGSRCRGPSGLSLLTKSHAQRADLFRDQIKNTIGADRLSIPGPLVS